MKVVDVSCVCRIGIKLETLILKSQFTKDPGLGFLLVFCFPLENLTGCMVTSSRDPSLKLENPVSSVGISVYSWQSWMRTGLSGTVFTFFAHKLLSVRECVTQQWQHLFVYTSIHILSKQRTKSFKSYFTIEHDWCVLALAGYYLVFTLTSRQRTIEGIKSDF